MKIILKGALSVLVLASLNGCFLVSKVRDDYNITKSFFYGKEITSLSWTSSGKEILFTLMDRERSNIFEIKTDGTGLTQLTKDKTYDLGSVMSPIGSLIVFGSRGEGDGNQAHLYAMDEKGQNKRALTAGSVLDLNPAFSSDGKTIYFLRSVRFGQGSPLVPAHWWDFRIYSMAQDGTHLKAVSNRTFLHVGNLDVNKTGDMLVVESHDYENESSIWFIPAHDPDKVTAVRPNLEEFRPHFFSLKLQKINYLDLADPQFSPDGKSLLFEWITEKRTGLYLVDLASKRTRRIADFQEIINSPSFSPDGKQIAFVMYEPGPYLKSIPVIYIINTNGDNLHAITMEKGYKGVDRTSIPLPVAFPP